MNDRSKTLEVIVLSQPSVVNPGRGTNYYIFEMMPASGDDQERYPKADRAVMYQEPGEGPPVARAGERCTLTGEWQSEKAFRFNRLERVCSAVKKSPGDHSPCK